MTDTQRPANSSTARVNKLLAQQQRPAQRDERGQFLPGYTPNPNGRPKGSHNNTTLAAIRRCQTKADRAMQVVEAKLESPFDWVAMAAAKVILDRAFATEDKEDPETDWVLYATERELRVVADIVARCNKRREAGVAAGGGSVSPDEDQWSSPSQPEVIDLSLVASAPAAEPEPTPAMLPAPTDPNAGRIDGDSEVFE